MKNLITGLLLTITFQINGAFFIPVYADTAKNVILMISDGQGMSTIMAADFYQGNRSVYESFPVKYFVSTYSRVGSYNPEIAWDHFDLHKMLATDSAAAATAMATGIKTVPFFVGQPIAENIVEKASQLGKATGVVTSVPISHATPAGMVVHNLMRNNYATIAKKMIYDSDLDLIMGAGHPLFDHNGKKRSVDEAEYQYVGGQETYEDLSDSDGAVAKDGKAWEYIEQLESFQQLAEGNLQTTKLIGLAQVAETLQQERDGDPQKVDVSTRISNVPELKTMALGALNVLSSEENGFFLMIEGGAVDWANHDNQKGRLIEEQMAFNQTVNAVVNWIENNSSFSETLLIVTADHDCGYIWNSTEKTFSPITDKGKGQIPEMAYHSDSHSNLLVPLYAKGPFAERFNELVDGTDDFMATLFNDFDPEFSGQFVDNTDIFVI